MTTKTQYIPIMIGPNGEMATGAPVMDKVSVDWSWIWDATEGWSCDECDIRKSFVEVQVPILGPNKMPDLHGSVDTPKDTP